MKLQNVTQSGRLLRSAVSFVAVAFLLFSSIAHIHVRYCLDGNEPVVSIHFENENTHVENAHLEQESSDVENEFSLDTVLSKLELNSISFAILNSFYYLSIPSDTGKLAKPELSPTFHTGIPATLLPPSQAPPVIV